MVGGGGKTLLLPLALLALAAAALAAIIAADFTTAQAQNEDEAAGRIVARLLEDGRVEFGWQPTGGARVLPRQRYFPTDATVDRWLRSSPVEVAGNAIGRINARLRADGRIEFAFTPTDGERIAPQARYFPAGARVGRWLRSTEIAIGPTEDDAGFIAISAGELHTCAIRESGEIVCWGITEGDYYYGQTDAPTGRFTTVSARESSNCAIRESEEIECWGLNGRVEGEAGTENIKFVETGLLDAPPGSYTAVSVGSTHTCAIRTSGEIECWGDNEDGLADAPAGRYTAVSAGIWHNCAIRDAGEIACWGANYTADYYVRLSEAPAGSFTAVSVGGHHTCGLRENGAIECWGHNEHGQGEAPAGTFTTVSASAHHTCGLRENGAIECWGWSISGVNETPEGTFTAVSTGPFHACAIREDKTITCWGNNAYPPPN